jgi:hypothetical protein
LSFFELSLKFIGVLPINKEPVVGLSIIDKTFSNVDFPDPDGPTRE